MRRAGVCLVAGLVGALLVGVGLAATPTQIVARLDAERVANGIPGGISLDPAQTRGCEHHLRYEELNGIAWTHTETPGKPGYTKDGALAAATGDQADTGGWESGDPYENLPLHMANLLNPRLQRVGAAESGARTCITVIDNTRVFSADKIFVVPGNGRTGVPSSQVAHGESPFAPGDLVGLPQGTATGPTVYVFGVGPWGGTFPQVVRASLRGPGGPVAIRIVDTRRHPELSAYVPGGAAFLLPVRPLAAGTYTGSVTLAGGGATLSRTWRFRVG